MAGNDVHEAVSQAISYLRGLWTSWSRIQVTHENELGSGTTSPAYSLPSSSAMPRRLPTLAPEQ